MREVEDVRYYSGGDRIVVQEKMRAVGREQVNEHLTWVVSVQRFGRELRMSKHSPLRI